jgi:hypothetical protein
MALGLGYWGLRGIDQVRAINSVANGKGVQSK